MLLEFALKRELLISSSLLAQRIRVQTWAHVSTNPELSPRARPMDRRRRRCLSCSVLVFPDRGECRFPPVFVTSLRPRNQRLLVRPCQSVSMVAYRWVVAAIAAGVTTAAAAATAAAKPPILLIVADDLVR